MVNIYLFHFTTMGNQPAKHSGEMMTRSHATVMTSLGDPNSPIPKQINKMIRLHVATGDVTDASLKLIIDAMTKYSEDNLTERNFHIIVTCEVMKQQLEGIIDSQMISAVTSLLGDHSIVDSVTLQQMRAQVATPMALDDLVAYIRVIVLTMTNCAQGKITSVELGQILKCHVLKCHVAANE